MFPSKTSRILDRNQGVAFSSYSRELARKQGVKYAEDVLWKWVDGQEREYAVRDVLNELHLIFDLGAVSAISLIKQAMSVEFDDPLRTVLVSKAIQLLEGQIRNE